MEMWTIMFLLFLHKFTINSGALHGFENLFSSHIKCIEGSFFDPMSEKAILEGFNRISDYDGVKSDTVNEILHSPEELNYRSKVNDLAHYNQIEYYYELISEEGLAHQKVFNVSLILGDEIYYGVDTSLEKARENAAKTAWFKTKYEHPPIKNKDVEKQSPTVVLNNFGLKLGFTVKYYLIHDIYETLLSSKSQVILDSNSRSYLKRLNDSMNSTSFFKVKSEDIPTKGPYTVKVVVNEDIFHGVGHTIQGARHQAALKAIDVLKNRIFGKDFACLKEGHEKECKMLKDSIKSPISRIFEAGQKRGLNVECNEIGKTGPDHKPTFAFQCILGDFITEGSATSKKEAKRLAAEEMLKHMSELPEVPLDKLVDTNQSNKKSKKNKKRMIKNTFDKVSMMLDGVVNYFQSPPENDNQGAEQKNDELTKKRMKSSKQKKSYFYTDDTEKLSSKEKLLKIGNMLNFEVYLKDFENTNKIFTLINLSLKPPYICIGEGLTPDISQNGASLNALKFLHTSGLLDKLSSQKLNIDRFPYEDYINLLEDFNVEQSEET